MIGCAEQLIIYIIVATINKQTKRRDYGELREIGYGVIESRLY